MYLFVDVQSGLITFKPLTRAHIIGQIDGIEYTLGFEEEVFRTRRLRVCRCRCTILNPIENSRLPISYVIPGGVFFYKFEGPLM